MGPWLDFVASISQIRSNTTTWFGNKCYWHIFFDGEVWASGMQLFRGESENCQRGNGLTFASTWISWGIGQHLENHLENSPTASLDTEPIWSWSWYCWCRKLNSAAKTDMFLGASKHLHTKRDPMGQDISKKQSLQTPVTLWTFEWRLGPAPQQSLSLKTMESPKDHSRRISTTSQGPHCTWWLEMNYKCIYIYDYICISHYTVVYIYICIIIISLYIYNTL